MAEVREGRDSSRREAQAQGQWSPAAQVRSPGQELDPVSCCILPAREAGPRQSLRACAVGSRGRKRLGMRSGYREEESSAPHQWISWASAGQFVSAKWSPVNSPLTFIETGAMASFCYV